MQHVRDRRLEEAQRLEVLQPGDGGEQVGQQQAAPVREHHAQRPFALQQRDRQERERAGRKRDQRDGEERRRAQHVGEEHVAERRQDDEGENEGRAGHEA